MGTVAVAQKPAPPSTGRELPQAERRVLSHDVQLQLLQKGLSEFAKGGSCPNVYNVITAAILGGDKVLALDGDTQPAYAALAVCASRTEHHLAALRVSAELYKRDPQTPLAYLVPESEVALGMYKDAIDDLKALLGKRPKDAHVALVYAAASCKLEVWSACLPATDKVAALLGEVADASEKKLIETQLHAVRAEALFHTGKFDESSAELTAAITMAGREADPAWDKRLKRNEIVKSGKLAVEPLYDKSVPLGVYHLLGQVKGTRPVLTLKLYNFDEKPRNVRIEVEIPGVTEKKVTTKMLMPGKKEVAELTPPLRTDFPIGALRAERPSQLSIKVSVGSDAIYEKSYPITVLPRDTLPLSQRIDADLSAPTPGFIAAWVTPNAKAVDAFLNDAKKRINGTFAGDQMATFPQVKAIWDELSAQGVSYVMDPAVLADFGFAQRTRLPAEVLQSKNAQCLEGTILFATLLEAIGLEPIIVRVPGHAFVGWRPNARDGARPGDLAFVETTMVHDAKFEDATRVALNRVLEEKKAGHFAKGIYGPAFMLEVSDLRKQGFRPQPVE
jgi:tetratricopeptide (TPR) repeat protein